MSDFTLNLFASHLICRKTSVRFDRSGLAVAIFCRNECRFALVEVTIKFLGREAIFLGWITAPSETPKHTQKMTPRTSHHL